MQQSEPNQELPYTLSLAKKSTHLFLVEGHYDIASQQWSERDICSVTTWSRSSTTGLFTDDADEDKDD